MNASIAVDMENGEAIILKFGQGLWFGERLERTLINPTQCNAHGIRIWDSPMISYRRLGIGIDSQLTVPMSTRGASCRFIIRCPTDEELNSCWTYQIPSYVECDPYLVVFDVCRVKRHAKDGSKSI